MMVQQVITVSIMNDQVVLKPWIKKNFIQWKHGGLKAALENSIMKLVW